MVPTNGSPNNSFLIQNIHFIQQKKTIQIHNCKFK